MKADILTKSFDEDNIYSFCCKDPDAQSLLYDLDLTTVQVDKKHINYARMLAVGSLLKQIKES